ncbi:MAG TPA: flagellar hook-basal body protein, partial [Polyangiaceae bacterium]|nr:flagellar hook-basal body protein [Polyangiaceae bacterium]
DPCPPRRFGREGAQEESSGRRIMSDGIWSAASGAISQVMALDVAAENVANASTPAYHGDRVVFREVLTRATAKKQGGFNLKYGAVGSIATDPLAGAITVTGRPLDVALKGPSSYLVVKTAQGERYTRYGSLEVNKNGMVVTRDGDAVLGLDRKPVRLTPGSKVSIASDATVTMDGAPSGQLLTVQFKNPAGLAKEGSFLLRGQPAAGPPAVAPPELETGALEGSNVSPVKGMVDIVNASRAFEVCERVIDAFRDADRRAALDVMGLK